jgi:carbon storage regulator
MLVLTRKAGERILIGDSIVVTVARIDGCGVRLGVEAPADVKILRAELLQVHDPAAKSGDVASAG